MSVRQIRRVFATPFIVTSIAATACGPKPLPKHENPPGPHTNPPAPETTPAPNPTAEVTPTDPPAPKPPVVAEEPVKEPVKEPAKDGPRPPREPAAYEQHWTVQKFKGQDTCSAMVDVKCPKPEPGKVMPTCNPPPPIKYACPDGFAVGDTLRIVQRAGSTDCTVEREPMKCPPNTRCNPPPPRKIPCPER